VESSAAASRADDRATVAILGVGHMGGAMAGTLRRAEFDVTVWNRTEATAAAVAARTGAVVAASATDAVRDAEVVISSLADDDAVLATYTGSSGVAPALHTGQTVLEMSTIAPATVHAIRPSVQERGAALLDAPVSGSVTLADAGTLTVMVGGDPEALERVRPVLDALAAKVFHVGGPGSGATVKLAVNALIHAIDVGLSEALVLAERAGVERSVAYDVFAGGAAAAPFVLYKRDAFEHPEGAPTAFSLDLMKKDLDLILALAGEVGLHMGQAELNRMVVRDALEAGFTGRDMSAIAAHLRERG
jgi:3-hydroxyisobutyrate dehydrogenase-like beta-hydroxyacid dehydrogenase